MGRGLAMLFEYETPKLVQISNLKIGVAHRIIQLIILIYVVCWVLMYEKAYQYNDEAKCAVTTKVKGVGFTDAENIPGIGKRSWDIADYIIPPLENNAFFVATNLIVTPKQKLGKCAEHIHVPGTSCASDDDCNPKEIVHIGNGVHTGHCLLEPGKPEGVCEIHSWCPLENDSLPLGPKTYMFPMVQNYTLLIKNDITFEKFGVHRRNILPWSSKRFLRSCTYDKNHEEYKYCPIFKLSTIFEEAGVDPSIFIWGGVIGIDIQWDCDLDWDVKYCNPIYSFSRLDDANAKIASGFNFRYANFYYSNGTLHRDLIKAYGIRFIIHAHGKAGKFNIIPLTMNIGSGLALLGLAPTICDIIALNILHSRRIYQKAKFETIAEEKAHLAARRATRATMAGENQNDQDTATNSITGTKRRKRKNKKHNNMIEKSLPTDKKGKREESSAATLDSFNELPPVNEVDPGMVA